MSDKWVLEDDDDDDEDDDDEEPTEGTDRGGDDSRLMEKFLQTRTILVCEAITDTLARRVYQNLLLLESEDPHKTITVVINSPGGEADSGFGIMDMLRFVESPIRTLVAGLCASAAILVGLAADREKRFSLPHSRFLLHQPMAASFGQAADLEIASAEILKLRDRYNKIVSEQTGHPVAEVTKDSDRDFWMSGPDAMEYGLVHRIVSSRKEFND